MSGETITDENGNSINVKRWRGGNMMLRWVAAGVLEAVKASFTWRGIPTLVSARQAHDQHLGLFTHEGTASHRQEIHLEPPLNFNSRWDTAG